MRNRWGIAVLLIAVGCVFIAQGLGYLRGSSFMVDDIRWALIGLALAVAGFAIAATVFRTRSRP